MKIAVIDDYQNAFKTLKCYPKLAGHEVVIYTEPETNVEKIAERLKDADAVILTQQRTAFPRALIEKLPKLKLIGQTGRAASHVDLEACTDRGVVVSAGGSGNSNATAELTWGLILSALRNLPFEVKRLKEGRWQSTLGIGVNGKTLGIYAYGKIGSIVAGVGKAFGARVVCWGREGSTGRAKAAGFEVAKSRDGVFRGLRYHQPAFAAQQRYARHCYARRSGAHEADGVAGKPEPLGADREGRVGRGAQSGPTGQSGGRRL